MPDRETRAMLKRERQYDIMDMKLWKDTKLH